MPPPHQITGLIASARRDEWRDALADRIDRHAAKAVAAAGIGVADIEALLGGYGVSTLRGAAFEDLRATDLPAGRNVADDYLGRRGWEEGMARRDRIAGLRRSVISLYARSGLVPGESMRLRDRVRRGRPARLAALAGRQRHRAGPPAGASGSR